MKVTQDIYVKHKNVVSVCCDKCGKTAKGETEMMWSDINEIAIDFGFGSKFDGETWSFELCDDCVEDTLKDIMSNVKKKEWNI